MILRLITRILGNSLALYLAARFVPNFSFTQDWKILLIAGSILTVFNLFLKPLLKLISIPLIIVSLGLFSIIINILILWLMTKFFPDLIIVGFKAYLWGTIIISLTNWLIATLIKEPKKEN
ncbi:MAG: hypothetical protein UV36_C0005G0004 [Parcubacteria group bacterium GW2011_GWC2_42_6]|nr:MAG: hypothetical protein UV36_C0005G0004 [Parcubacteria group bacterium GW2011_GWC2_42_6]